ncbi:MAG TPA: type III pantothenate kinase [Burkholderiales bacterium]|jgi:type III pantothenate kinase|nr:type III pantothenate kinase [Burkholderiales bacterium]
MILAIDAGNSRVKWGFHAHGGWTERGTIITADAPRLAAAWHDVAAPCAIVVANVAGSEVKAALTLALRHFTVQPQWVVAQEVQCGVRSRYADPAQLGADRWAALIGAWHRWRRAALVVHAGTALTADALSHDGEFLGGVIVPGHELMSRALAAHTAGLRRQPGAFHHFPRATGDAIVSGTINALCGTIERMVRFMEQGGEESPLIVIGGGDADSVAEQLGAPVQRVDNLVLEGLAVIAREPINP